MKHLKYVIIMLVAGLTFASDNQSCERGLALGDPSIVCKDSCSHLTKDQTDCVIRKHCNKEIAKGLKKQHAAEKRVRELEDELLKAKTKKKDEAKKNSLSLVGGATKTGVAVTPVPNLPLAEVNTEHQLDVGVMYQRDVSDEVRLSIQATVRKNVYLGIGYNF